MTARARTTIVAAASLAVSMIASILLLHHIDEIRPKATIEDVLYIDSPKIVKRASLGFNGPTAVIYWTRTVQYFGHRHFLLSHSYNELAPLLEITTTLDPHLFRRMSLEPASWLRLHRMGPANPCAPFT